MGMWMSLLVVWEIEYSMIEGVGLEGIGRVFSIGSVESFRFRVVRAVGVRGVFLSILLGHLEIHTNCFRRLSTNHIESTTTSRRLLP